MGRLDDFLQANERKPAVLNPSLTSEDFADMLDDDEYANFRSFVHKYRGWVDAAIAEEDFTKSVEAWQRIFGDQFAKDAVTKLAATSEEAAVTVRTSLLSNVAKHPDRLVDMVRDFGSRVLPPWFNKPPHLQAPSWPKTTGTPIDVYVSASYQSRKKGSDGRPVLSGDTVPPHGGLWLEARLWGGAPIDGAYRIEWRITNTGIAALSINKGRGGFYSPDSGSRRWEMLEYRGVHIAEAFLIRRADNVLVGQSEPFHVAIL